MKLRTTEAAPNALQEIFNSSKRKQIFEIIEISLFSQGQAKGYQLVTFAIHSLSPTSKPKIETSFGYYAFPQEGHSYKVGDKFLKLPKNAVPEYEFFSTLLNKKKAEDNAQAA